MPGQPFSVGGAVVDLSQRVATTSVVVASPALAAETIVAQVALSTNLTFGLGVLVLGFCSITIGTSGTSMRLRVRQTNVAGTVVADSDATTGGVAAAAKCDVNVNGFDASPPAAGVYVLTAQVAAGSAPSTVGFTNLTVIAF